MTRLQRAQAVARRSGIDTLVITPGADLRYLTGYTALPLERLTCLVLRVDADPVLVVPGLEKPAAVAAGIGFEIAAWAETDDPFALVAKLAGNPEKVGLDNHMWVSRALALRDALPEAAQVLAGPVLQELRIRKDPAEISALRAAGEAIDRVHTNVPTWLRPGRTEREVGADIARAILAEGHETVDFVIVGSGPNGASPHHELSNRVIELGDPVVVDIGGTMPSGYCSDSTRNYLAGEVAPEAYLDAYAVLLAAQTAQRAYARPGVTAESVDRIGRDIIDAAGYGEQFMHRTGHGIGQETHEEPYIVAGNDLILAPGMAFSIEPGIYQSGQFGARIEDIVVCTDDGIDCLNNTSRELVLTGG